MRVKTLKLEALSLTIFLFYSLLNIPFTCASDLEHTQQTYNNIKSKAVTGRKGKEPISETPTLKGYVAKLHSVLSNSDKFQAELATIPLPYHREIIIRLKREGFLDEVLKKRKMGESLLQEYIRRLISLPSSNNVNDDSSLRCDLHGLSVLQARQTVVATIKHAYCMNACFIHFITGRGNHMNAKGGRGVLFKQFPRWLNDENVSSLVEGYKSNPGVYEVSLKMRSKIPSSPTKISSEDPEIQQPAVSPYMQGLQEYEKKNYKKAAGLFLTAAKQGVPEAQHKLGYLHGMGLGVRYSPRESRKWYNSAATQDYVPSLINLGNMYWIGEGVKSDLDQALVWYEKAARKGSTLAKRNLAIIYFRKKDYENSFRWNMEASLEGDTCAQVNLGCMYQSGLSTDRDIQEAIYWFWRSAKQDVAEGQMRLACAYYNTDQKPVKTVKLLLNAMLKGDKSVKRDAQHLLSKIYREGRGVAESISISHTYLFQAAENGHKEAQFEWGYQCKRQGRYKEAFEWLHQAANVGIAKAYYELGEMHANGFGTEVSERRALDYYKKAADQGDVFSQLFLGYSTEETEYVRSLCALNDIGEMSEEERMVLEAKHGICILKAPPSLPNTGLEDVNTNSSSGENETANDLTWQESRKTLLERTPKSINEKRAKVYNLGSEKQEEQLENIYPQEAWEPSWMLSLFYNGFRALFN